MNDMSTLQHPRLRQHRGLPSQTQRGAATLIVVAILFFIVSLVAAYTNRNLIFEQRTSANQLRSTLALEAAEAGVEWAVAMLNLGRIDNECQPVDDTTLTSFRDRYLEVDTDTGLVGERANMAAGSTPTCVNDAGQWRCSCPATGAPSISNPPIGTVAPAFRLRFTQWPKSPPGSIPLDNRPGTIWVDVQACTRLDDDCLTVGQASAQAGEGRARTVVLLALRSALPSPPVAAVTARGNINLNDSAIRVVNTLQGGGSSLALQAGGALSGASALELTGAAGEIVTLQNQVRAPDPALAITEVPDSDRLFGSVFGIQPGVYRDQPATLVLDCANTCNADTLRAVLDRNPGRLLWANGDVDLDGAGGPLGTAAEPVFLVVEGSLTTNNIQINGFIYSSEVDWSFTATNTTLRGAVLAGNNLDLSGTIEVIRDAATLDVLRWRHGTYLRVPGGWSDY
jgi:hypothetical protein